MLLLITCSKESDVSSDAYASSASQNTYTPPNTTTAPTVTQFTLAVTATNGGGVSSTGGTYDNGTSVSITATPNEGYEFVGWNGTDMSSSTITITLTANTTIEALFSQVSTTTTVIQFTLAVSASNGGTVSTEGGDFEEGTEVTITATANAGYRFTGWEGSDSTSESLTVTLNSDQTYQALFELIPVYTLSVTTSAEGGTVSTEGGDFEEGTEVTITATANAGYRFTGWEGSDSTSESLTVTLNSDQTYQALFELIPASVYTISVSAQGSANYILTGDDANGSVSGNDPSVSLKVGDTINFDVSAQGHPFYLIKTSDGGFGSGNLVDGVSNNGAQSATVSWTPTEAGTYYYICEYHPSMLGTITVTE
jgi:uncharacterized repeat protein (TIGR02543 family)